MKCSAPFFPVFRNGTPKSGKQSVCHITVGHIFRKVSEKCGKQEKNKFLLNIRIFNEPIKKKVYARQIRQAEAEHISNCPYCTMSDGANKSRIYRLNEMDADHVTALEPRRQY